MKTILLQKKNVILPRFCQTHTVSMVHYILTRFNLNLFARDKYGNATLTEEWLENRFQLFETYSLPSIKAQTSKNFYWLVLMDRDTPKFYLDRMYQHKEQCPNLRIIRVKPEGGPKFLLIFQQVIQKDFFKGRGTEDNLVLSTWMDNDDSLSIDFVERLQNEAGKLPRQNPTFIIFHYGLQYFVKRNLAVNYRYDNNHFISLLESYGPQGVVRTAFGYGSHWSVFDFKDCGIHNVMNKNHPAWIEVVHGSNVSNDLFPRKYGYKPLTDGSVLKKQFGLDVVPDKHPVRLFFTFFIPRLIKVNIKHFYTRSLEKAGIKKKKTRGGGEKIKNEK